MTQLTSSSGDGAACPNDSVVFTCTVTGRTDLLWEVEPPLNHTHGPSNTATAELLIGVTSSDGTLLPSGPEGFMFQPALTATSSNSLTSTLTTLTEVSLLNSTTVSCLGNPAESLTIIVAGEFMILHSCHGLICLLSQTHHLLLSLRWCLHNKMVSVPLCSL